MNEQVTVEEFPKPWTTLLQIRMDIYRLFQSGLTERKCLFLARRPTKQYNDLEDYDTNINVYKSVAGLDNVYHRMYCFNQVLDSVHKTPSIYVTTTQQAYIAEKLEDIRRIIIEGASLLMFKALVIQFMPQNEIHEKITFTIVERNNIIRGVTYALHYLNNEC